MKPGGNHHIHFIAIGGSAMHNLAIALSGRGYQVTGSDDDIFEPSRSRLSKYHLLPTEMGWFPDKITPNIQAVILGMHARSDNPELLKAQEMGVKVYSFPDFIYEMKKSALRVVVAGSHGKTTITSMIAYTLAHFGDDFDYLIGAGIPGFENMVKISEAPLMILEGDEYLSSSVDRTPKFIRYRHNIGLVSGIAWDHINAFPSKEDYVEQFRKFIHHTPDGGQIIYNREDKLLRDLIEHTNRKMKVIPYSTPRYEVIDEKYNFILGSEKIPMKVFGRHNMSNLAGALAVLKVLGHEEYKSLQILRNFSGASNRLEKIYEDNKLVILKDFAHSPSKLRSTIQAVKELYSNRPIINCFELHTYSSLNKKFIQEYKNSFSRGDINVIFLHDHTLEIKKMESLSDDTIRKGFMNNDLVIIRKTEELIDFLVDSISENTVLLMMSSGNFGGLDYKQLKKSLQLKLK